MSANHHLTVRGGESCSRGVRHRVLQEQREGLHSDGSLKRTGGRASVQMEQSEKTLEIFNQDGVFGKLDTKYCWSVG